MAIDNDLYRQISRNDLVRKKNGGVYRVVNVLRDQRRDCIVGDQVNNPAESVVQLVQSNIESVWFKQSYD